MPKVGRESMILASCDAYELKQCPAWQDVPKGAIVAPTVGNNQQLNYFLNLFTKISSVNFEVKCLIHFPVFKIMQN